MRKSVLVWVAACSMACSEANAPDREAAFESSAFELLQSGARRSEPSLPHSARRDAVVRGATRLASLQADSIGDNAHNGLDDGDPDDGGWDFTLPADAGAHSAAASPENNYGATALGLFAAVIGAADRPRFRTALLDAGLGAQRRPEVDSPPDFVFLTLLSDVADNPGFTELARARYDTKVAVAGGALALGTGIRDLRHRSGNDGLIAYDLAWLMLAAEALDSALPDAGYAEDAGSYAALVIDDLMAVEPKFDSLNASQPYYVQGLAWSLVALSRSAVHATLAGRVRALLLAAQRADGAWAWNAAIDGANAQATAHSVQALALVSRHAPHSRTAAQRGARWLLQQQLPNGSWSYAVGLESPLLDGEILLGLQLAYSRSPAPPNPEPAPSEGAASVSSALGAEGKSTPALAQPF